MQRLALSAALALTGFASSQSPESIAPFEAPVVVSDESTRIDALVDLNGDGHKDLIGVWLQHIQPHMPKLDAFLSDGKGGLTHLWSHVTLPRRKFTDAICAANLNGDAFEDFYVMFDTTLMAYRSNGTARPTVLARVELGAVRDITAEDFDGDGIDECVVLAGNQLSVVTLSNGALIPHSVTGQIYGTYVRTAELTGDATPDILIDNRPNIEIWEYDATNGLQRASRMWYGVTFPAPTVGDVDGDGDTDIVVFMAPTQNEYTLWRRTGPANFEKSVMTGGPATELADINGDGIVDGICCGGGGGNVNTRNNRASTFHIAANDGTGRFAPAKTFPGLGSKRIAGATDLDGDGDNDLIAGRAVWFNRGTLDMFPIVVGNGRDAIDIDQDGDADVAPGVDWTRVHDGDGQFAMVPTDTPDPATGSWVGPGWRGDFDGDGDVDLIVGHRSGVSQFHSMRLLANRGGASFEDAGPATPNGVWFNPNYSSLIPFMPQDGVVVDLEGDGDLDVVASMPRTASKMENWVFLNDGTGFFQRTPTPLLGYHVIDAADFDGDGLVDLVAIQVPSTLLLVPQTAAGTFGTPIDLNVSVYYVRDQIAVADFNQDGAPDLGVIDRVIGANAQPLWLENQGGLNFLKHRLGDSVEVVLDPAFDAADLNGDGIPDAVIFPVTQSTGASRVVTSANGTPLVNTAIQMTLPGALVDADGDGDVDVLGYRLTRGARFASGARRQYGEGSRGLGGATPILGARGPFQVGETMTVIARGLPGGALFSWQFGLGRGPAQDFPLPGMVGLAHPYLVSFTFAAAGAAGGAGTGAFETSFAVPAALGGVTLWQQLHVLDPSRPWQLGWTNGLEIEIGH